MTVDVDQGTRILHDRSVAKARSSEGGTRRREYSDGSLQGKYEFRQNGTAEWFVHRHPKKPAPMLPPLGSGPHITTSIHTQAAPAS
jgi:hypothetical protein